MGFRFLTLLLIAAAAVCVGCSSEKPAPPNAAVSPTPSIRSNNVVFPKDGNYPAKGKVTKINNELGSLELDHEEIPGLMPKMIMEFFVKDKALLNGLAVGDEVDFVVEYKHPAETIVSVTKVR